ncbi:MAG: tetratricopeptide repeat protein [Anaerolineae bacterium]|nr:tetratricopeptide repeat protein [Anaerolineae bacterium]
MPFEWPGAKRARAQQHYERALRYYREGKRLLAIADLSEAIKANRRRAEFYSTRAMLWAQEEEYTYAQRDGESALALNPRDLLAYYVLGMAAHAEARYDDAIRCFTQALECAPQRSECYYFRSVCHYENGAPEQAEIDMHFARQLMPAADTRQLDAARWLGVFQKARKTRSRRL